MGPDVKRARKRLSSRGKGGRRRSRSNRKRRRRNLSKRPSGAQLGSKLGNSVTEGFFQGQSGLNNTQVNGSQSARGGNKTSKWRGKVTFWNDLHTTYF